MAMLTAFHVYIVNGFTVNRFNSLAPTERQRFRAHKKLVFALGARNDATTNAGRRKDERKARAKASGCPSPFVVKTLC